MEQRPGALATLIELEVVESFKGKHEPGAAITLLQMGGTLGDLVQVIPGTSRFQSGEEVVLFLSAFQERFVQVGIGLGRFLVKRSGRPLWSSRS